MAFATKKVGTAYEAALLVDNKFQRSASGESLLDLFIKLCGPALGTEQETGAEVAVLVSISTADDVKRDMVQEDLARQKAAAEQEMRALESLAETQRKVREARANMGGKSGSNPA